MPFMLFVVGIFLLSLPLVLPLFAVSTSIGQQNTYSLSHTTEFSGPIQIKREKQKKSTHTQNQSEITNQKERTNKRKKEKQ